ncbi:MAG TPA: hypothetical protein PKO09_15510 [Anaerolineae bacterium]|nr:hypothetical protein [Anaerolineae bacterium]
MIGLGMYGTWLRDTVAALSLNGADLGEFVKFLPAVQGGALHIHRLVFYLPVVALAVSVSLAIASPPRLPTTARRLAIILALLVSLLLLPPAWSLPSLRTSEFRVQVTMLGACLLLLASSRWISALSPVIRGSLVGLVSISSAVLPAEELRTITPEVTSAYGTAPRIGWGFWAVELGLALVAVWSLVTALSAARSKGS